MAAHQAPPSLGFSRQEHWSGLPFPSPPNSCVEAKISKVLCLEKGLYEDCVQATLQLYTAICNPVDYSPPGSSVHGDSPGKNTGVGCHALLQGIFLTQGSNPRLLCLLHWQVGSLPLVPPGEPQTHIVLEKWDLKHPFLLHPPLFTCFPTGSSCLQTSHAVYLPLNKP